MDRNPLTTEIELALLLQRTAARDPAAFRALYDKTAPILFARLLRMLPQRNHAEEALQEAYVRVWESAARFPAHRGQPLPWLLTAARYCALDLLRRKRMTHETGLERIETDDETSPNHFDEDLAALSAEQRRALALAFVQGLSLEDIAIRTSRSLFDVKREIRAGLLGLRAGNTRGRRAA
jgi:RNA polymerase sigma-70 factor, ECF subfamily